MADFPVAPVDQHLTSKLVVHHVGARGYGVSFYVPPQFRSDLVHVLYEADAEAVERMLREEPSALAEALEERHVFPYCLGRRAGRATLNITANSYVSSLLTPDPGFGQYYCEIAIDGARYDVTYDEMLRVVRKVDVELHSLDELLSAGKMAAPPPDFLSLDTQGYELEILEGATATLSRGGVALMCEVEMVPMYRAQPLLPDILAFARRHGFMFAGFTSLFEISPRRAPVGLRGKALPGFGDALFLRDLNWFSSERVDVNARYVMLHKLSFVSLCLGYVEYGLEAAARASAIEAQASPHLRQSLEARAYTRFLRQVQVVAQTHESRYLPVHAVPDNSREPGDGRTSWYDTYHHAALNRMILRDILTVFGASRLGRVVRRIIPSGALRNIRRVAAHSSSDGQRPSAFEELLETNGFLEVASLVRQRRITAERYLGALSRAMAEAGQATHLPKR